MNSQSNITASLMTPPGSGGIAVIEVRGPGAAEVFGGIFKRKSKGGSSSDSLQYGHIHNGAEIIDEVIAREISPDHVEVNCHGGVAVAGELLRLLSERGVREVPWQEALEGESIIRQAALKLLPYAATKLAARVICDQLNGALERALANINLKDKSAANELSKLAATTEFGIALTQPRKIALIGWPNAGKSSLFNALVGHSRVIVSPTPGTTRDYVNERINLGGFPVELIDTAGIRTKGGVVEMKGVEATWTVASKADVLVVVIDASRRMSPQQKKAVEMLLPRKPVVCLNKIDLSRVKTALPACIDVCEISAATGQGIESLQNQLLCRLPQPEKYPPGSPVVLDESLKKMILSFGTHQPI